MKTKENNI